MCHVDRREAGKEGGDTTVCERKTTYKLASSRPRYIHTQDIHTQGELYDVLFVETKRQLSLSSHSDQKVLQQLSQVA